MKMVWNVWKSLMVGDNVKEEERRSAELGEQVFIDLTVGGEEDEEAAEKEAEEEGLMRSRLESESLLTDVSSDDESEVSNLNDNGMNDDYGLLINSGG